MPNDVLLLQYMTNLKKLQSERDSGAWDNLPDQARQQVFENLLLLAESCNF